MINQKVLTIVLCALLVFAAGTSSANIVINEIMQNPAAVGDSDGEWFELYNAGTETYDLDGWVVRDNDDDYFSISGTLEIAPGEYLILGRNGDSDTNGGVEVDYVYEDFTLSNSADEVVVLDPSLNEMDRVEYDGGPLFPDPNGASMALNDPTSDNNVGENWFESQVPWEDGSDYGTPGGPNVATGAIIEADPVTLNFGVIEVEQSLTLYTTISNEGDETLEISGINIDNEVFWTETGAPLSIEPGNSIDIDVTFSPGEAGTFEGTLTIINNSLNEGEYNINLTGSASEFTVTSIADIQADPSMYELVTIEGVVTVGAGVTHGSRLNAFVQDESGKGIMIYNSSIEEDHYETFARGNLVRVTGTVVDYESSGCTTTEITDFTAELLGEDHNIPTPHYLPTGDAASMYAEWDGTLVQSNGTIMDLNTVGGGTNITIDDGTGSVVFRVWESTGIDLSALELEMDIVLRGIGSCYSGAAQYLPAYSNHVVIPANLVINEIMQNPSAVNDSDGEWFEIYNAGSQSVDLLGYSVEDNGGESFAIETSLVIDPDGYLVLGVNGDFDTNGGVVVDYVYPSNFYLANSDDELILFDAQYNEIDRVEYDGGPLFPDPNGASMALIDPALDNNVGENWVESITQWGDNTDYGTPGESNALGDGAVIDANPSYMDFGTLEVNESTTLYTTIANNGNESLEISEITIDNPVFTTITTAPQTIEPGNTLDIDITFAPTEEDTFDGTLTLVNNSLNNPNLTVNLHGIAAALVVTPIADIQADPSLYETVTVEGVVTVGAGITNSSRLNAFVQDESGKGILIYDSSIESEYYDTFVRGNLVRITGTVIDYESYGCTTTEITDFTAEVLAQDQNIPTPYALSTGDAASMYAEWDGTLVQSNGQITDVFTAGGGTNITINDGSGDVVFRVWESTGIDLMDLEVGQNVVLRGAGSCYSGSAQYLPAYSNHVIILPQLVINEIMKNPDVVGDAEGEWFEIYNPSTDPIDLQGWSIEDNDSDGFVIESSLVINPDDYLVFGVNGDFETNGGVEVDYVYSSFTLGNGADEIVLFDIDYNEIDRVEYDNGDTFPDPSGASMELYHPDLNNNIGANWGVAVMQWGEDTDYGTPGAVNSIYSDGAFIMVDPMVVDFGIIPHSQETALQTVTIYNNGMSDLEITTSIDPSDVGFDFGTPPADPIVVLPGESTSLEIIFYTGEVGTYEATLILTNNSVNNPLVEVPLTIIVVPDNLPSIVVNEIMYNPAEELGDDDYFEFVELYNAGDNEVDLTGWIFRDDDDEHAFNFPDGQTIAANGYLVLASNLQAFTSFYGDLGGNVIGDFNIEGTFNLSNGGDQVRIFDQDGFLIDMVEYDDGNGWPTEADGDGPSLELNDPALDNTLPENWSATTVDGTPGMMNFGETHRILPDSWTVDFGITQLGNSLTEIITLMNRGNTPLTVSSITSDNPLFTIDFTDPVQIAVGGSYAFDVVFTPTEEGEFTGALTVTSDADNYPTATIDLIGRAGELPPVIVINEIMQNPSVDDDYGEWFELYNASDEIVDLMNWRIADNDNDEHVIAASVVFGPGEYVVLGRNGDPEMNGGVEVDYVYDNYTLSNGSDEVVLFNSSSIEVDRVEYDNGETFPDPNGRSMELISPDLDNSLGINWKEASQMWGDNTDYGTPGAENSGYIISGNVVYCLNDQPVPDTELTLNDQTMMSDAMGEYAFYNLVSDDYTLTAAKAAYDWNRAIGAFDAARVLQNAAGIYEFNDCQMIAGDVTGDGNVTSFDAAQIALYEVGLGNDMYHVGEWTFVPESYAYTPLEDNMEYQNFDAILYGDVTGNWTPETMMSIVNKNNNNTVKNGVEASLIASAPNEWSIVVDNISDAIAFKAVVNYDSAVDQFVEIKTIGTLSENFSVVTNDDAGELRIAAYGIQAIEGNGALLTISFQRTGLANTAMTLTELVINEGTLPVEISKAMAEAAVPTAYQLHQNVPNPFNPRTTIAYELPQAGTVNLNVYDASGKLVKTLVNADQTAGTYQIEWNGTDDNNRSVNSGVYFYRLETENYTSMKRMVLLK